MNEATVVEYQNKTYKVLANKYLGDFQLYKLASDNEDGSPFGALKTDCKVIQKKMVIKSRGQRIVTNVEMYWSVYGERFVTIPE